MKKACEECTHYKNIHEGIGECQRWKQMVFCYEDCPDWSEKDD